MTLTQHATRSLISFRPAELAHWLRALAHRLRVKRPADDTVAVTYLSTRRWSDATERELHRALQRRPQQLDRW
jgi:hypothetical protein